MMNIKKNNYKSYSRNKGCIVRRYFWSIKYLNKGIGNNRLGWSKYVFNKEAASQ